MSPPPEPLPTSQEVPQTTPVLPSNRLPSSDISIERCTEDDALKLAEGWYTCFPPSWWAPKEPPSLRPSSPTRLSRMAKRILPSLTQPGAHWLKAVHVPTRTIVGAACWADPSLPCHSLMRRDAVAAYGWQAKMGWTDDEVDDMWAHVDGDMWTARFARDDAARGELVGGPHWYLAPLMTWPEWQGKGVARRLVDWAVERADASVPPEPMFLESRPHARAMYMHFGFEPCGEYRFIRRGPKVVDDEEKVDEEDSTRCSKSS